MPMKHMASLHLLPRLLLRLGFKRRCVIFLLLVPTPLLLRQQLLQVTTSTTLTMAVVLSLLVAAVITAATAAVLLTATQFAVLSSMRFRYLMRGKDRVMNGSSNKGFKQRLYLIMCELYNVGMCFIFSLFRMRVGVSFKMDGATGSESIGHQSHTEKVENSCIIYNIQTNNL